MLAIRLFGRPRFTIGDAEWKFAGGRKTIPLLAYLLVRREAPISREYLAALLWPDESEEAARANLRRHLHLLGKALPPAPVDAPYILNTQHTTQWNPAAGVQTDIHDFVAASANAGDLERGVALYTGPFLEEFYDDWIVAERERFLAMQLENLGKLVRRKRGERDFEGALADISRTLALDPWREDAIRTEMILRDELGDRSGALATYRAFAERLRADLDTEPMPETRAAYDALLSDHVPAHAVRDRDRGAESHRTKVRNLPFHGREEPLAMLLRAWTTAADGQGSFSLVGGEAGIGKSRLVSELLLRAEAQGARTYVGATPSQESVAHEAVADCLRASASLIERCELPQSTRAMLGRLVPAFSTAPAGSVPALSPEAERFALFEAVCEAFAALARGRPLLLVFEDVHWAGSATFALLEFLAHRLAGRPIAFVATYREDEIDRAHPLRAFRRKLERTAALTHVALRRFDRETIASIVREMRPSDGDAFERDVDDIFESSEGVPLFVEAALREGATALGGDGRLRLERRIGSLSLEALQALETASVIGPGFDVEVLREVLGWSEADVLVSIDRLIAAYLVREPLRRGRSDFTFTHHLIADAVYERIEPRVRARRHASIATVLTELYPDAFADRAAIVARHFERAGLDAQAARAYGVAARRSMDLYASDEAAAFASKALALRPADDLRCELLLLRASAADRLGDRDAQDRDLAEIGDIVDGTSWRADYLLARARRALSLGKIAESASFLDLVEAEENDGARLRDARILRAEVLSQQGAFVEARACMDASLEACERSGDVVGILAVLQSILTASVDSLDIAATAELGQRMLDYATRTGDIERQAFAHEKLGIALSRRGSIPDALAHLETARETYERVGDTLRAALAGYNVATVQIMLGRYDLARAAFEAAIPRLRELQNAGALATAYVNLASTEVLMGDAESGLTNVRRAIEELNEKRGGAYAQMLVLVATALRLLGRPAEAASTVREVLEMMRPYGDSEPLAEGLLLDMQLAADMGDLATARARRDELAGIGADTIAHSLTPEVYPWILASVADIEGDRAAAAAERARAVGEYRAHLEMLAPEGRDLYRRIPWLTDIDAYASQPADA